MPYDPRITAEVRAKAREAVRQANVGRWQGSTAWADAIINAILAEVVGPERVIVPREPTEAMMASRQEYTDRVWASANAPTAIGAWRAMISASQEGNDIQIKN